MKSRDEDIVSVVPPKLYCILIQYRSFSLTRKNGRFCLRLQDGFRIKRFSALQPGTHSLMNFITRLVFSQPVHIILLYKGIYKLSTLG